MLVNIRGYVDFENLSLPLIDAQRALVRFTEEFIYESNEVSQFAINFEEIYHLRLIYILFFLQNG